MSRESDTDHPIHELLRKRWSPVGYSDRMIADDDLLALFEAARWAASSFNEQPWSYIVARRDDPEAFERMAGCLMDANRAWAERAPVLAIGITSLFFQHNGKENVAAFHDLGLATATLSLEAMSRGIYLRQMIGIDQEKAQEIYKVPDTHKVFTGVAIGYPADPLNLPENLQKRDTAPRTRKPLEDFVFSGEWQQTADWVR